MNPPAGWKSSPGHGHRFSGSRNRGSAAAQRRRAAAQPDSAPAWRDLRPGAPALPASRPSAPGDPAYARRQRHLPTRAWRRRRTRTSDLHLPTSDGRCSPCLGGCGGLCVQHDLGAGVLAIGHAMSARARVSLPRRHCQRLQNKLSLLSASGPNNRDRIHVASNSSCASVSRAARACHVCACARRSPLACLP